MEGVGLVQDLQTRGAHLKHHQIISAHVELDGILERGAMIAYQAPAEGALHLLKAEGLGFRVYGLGFRVQGFGFRV